MKRHCLSLSRLISYVSLSLQLSSLTDLPILTNGMESKSLPYIEGCPPLGLSQLFSHSTLLPSFYPYAYATLNPLYFPKFNTCNFKATCLEWPGVSNEHLYFLRPSAQCLLPWRFSCSLLLIQKLFFPPASPWLAPAHPRIPSRWLKHLSWSASFLPWLRDLPDIRDRIWLILVLTAISGLWVNKWINEWTKGKRLQA